MIFKVPARREEIGDPLDMYTVNCDISPNYNFLERAGKKEDYSYGGRVEGRIVSWV